ncbi:MAG: TIGR03560 family F420-dependent LLM class oxidoreductase [Dehalococcoidia bacterium]|nr:TIGR03560 family F420-dependent LLM class oxidoreductase [Dehalococcoidia bacterium]
MSLALGVMVEGQEGLSWARWRQLLDAVEALGYESIWRSDHWFSFTEDRTLDALEPFMSFVLAAERTRRLRFGPLVSAVTFRPPALVARMAAQIDALSGGRFVLGMGAGWNVPEHDAFGIDFPPVRERLDRLEEAIQVARALWAPGPANFAGAHYQLRDAECTPKPAQGRLPIMVGGNGEQRTLRIVARHADEWNALYLTADAYRAKNAVLAERCAEVGRDPATIRRSMMIGYLVGRDTRELHAHLARLPAQRGGGASRDPERAIAALRERGWLIGTPDAIVEQCGRLAEAGLDRLMLHHLAIDDDAALELVAARVLPQLR